MWECDVRIAYYVPVPWFWKRGCAADLRKQHSGGSILSTVALAAAVHA